jgi:HD-like signal output (HDOD) protein
MKFETLFQSPKVLPAMPRVVQALMASFDGEAVHADSLTALISSDAVISAKLLRLANSAYFRVPEGVSSVRQAFHHLGYVNVRSLVIRIGLQDMFVNLPSSWRQSFWQHSHRTACAARYWAAMVGADAELAHTLGLLYSMGQLLMRTAMPDKVQALDLQVDPTDPQRQSLERDVFGFCFTDVGAELTRRWHFPAVFAQVIAGAGASPGSRVDPLAALIGMAAWQSWVSAQALDAAAIDASWPSALAAQVPLLPEQAGLNFPPWSQIGCSADTLLS